MAKFIVSIGVLLSYAESRGDSGLPAPAYLDRIDFDYRHAALPNLPNCNFMGTYGKVGPAESFYARATKLPKSDNDQLWLPTAHGPNVIRMNTVKAD